MSNFWGRLATRIRTTLIAVPQEDAQLAADARTAPSVQDGPGPEVFDAELDARERAEGQIS